MTTPHTTLISAAELAALREVRIVDCRFDLTDPARGAAAFVAGHIAGAVYAHLDHDLSGPPLDDAGRHPLPRPDQLCAVFGRLGISPGQQVVCYDDMGGALAAARLWWLLRYMGHVEVAVLDGGWQAWQASGGAEASGVSQASPTVFQGAPRAAQRVLLADLPAVQESLVDARDPARFRGEVEPIDPRAGHIPGARNHPFRRNLAATGTFLAPAALREAFALSLGTLPTASTVHYCGSGVSACHNVLAQMHAGLPEPRLYAGSWSEWCRDPDRPAAVGE